MLPRTEMFERSEGSVPTKAVHPPLYRQGRWALTTPADLRGMDWAAWERTARPPAVYAPPQLRKGRRGRVSCLHGDTPARRPWPLPALPAVPYCCGQPDVFGPSVHAHSLAAPEEWFLRLLSTGDSPNCPSMLRGIFWIRDNYFSETLITFHDVRARERRARLVPRHARSPRARLTRARPAPAPARDRPAQADWPFPFLGLKMPHQNVARAGSLACGLPVLAARSALHGVMRIEVAPSGEWGRIDTGLGRNVQLLYFVRKGDKFRRPDGTRAPLDVGDILAVSYSRGLDTLSAPACQYMMQRVAYLDSEGRMVKTGAYEELVAMSRGLDARGEAGSTDGSLPPLSHAQLVSYAPPARMPAPADRYLRGAHVT